MCHLTTVSVHIFTYMPTKVYTQNHPKLIHKPNSGSLSVISSPLVGVNFPGSGLGCQSVLVPIQHFSLFHVGSLSHVDSLSHPIQFYTHFPHKPVRDVTLIIQNSLSAVAPTSFLSEYGLRCMSFYCFSYFYFYFYGTDLCR